MLYLDGVFQVTALPLTVSGSFHGLSPSSNTDNNNNNNNNSSTNHHQHIDKSQNNTNINHKHTTTTNNNDNKQYQTVPCHNLSLTRHAPKVKDSSKFEQIQL